MRPVKRKWQSFGLHGKLFKLISGTGFAGSGAISFANPAD
jgi:hypothetical protein